MPRTSKPLTISARPDRHLVWDGGGSVRYIVADVQVPEAPPSTGGERLPLNLAIVIDASGSMTGAPLESAKVAVRGVAERLEARDLLSVVSFADEALIHLDGIPMDPAGRGLAGSAVQSLETRGSTNLSGGWFKGAECAATVMESRSGLHNRVILLSDGHANAGLLNPVEIAGHAEQLLARGLATSTVGVGDGYNPEYLRALAENGGGTMHDAEHPHEIVEVLMAELGDVRELAAENLRITVRAPEGVRAMAIQAGEPRWGPEATMRFGAVTANGTKRAVFRVRTPRGSAGEELRFELEARWRVPGEEAERSTATEVVLTYATGSLNTPQTRDPEATVAAGMAWHSAVLLHAARLNRAKQWAEASHFLEQELRFFRGYAEASPALLLLLEEIEAVHRESGRDWGERSRKEVEMLSYRQAQGKVESRQLRRPASASTLIGAKLPHPGVYEYPMNFDGDHWFVEAHRRRMLLDTGSPMSLGTGAFAFAGRTTALREAVAGVSLAELVRLVGVPFDGLLGMDLLAPHRVTFDGKNAVLRIGGRPPRGGAAMIATSFAMGVPTVPATISGVARNAFVDFGAKISYVAGGVANAGEEVEDFYPGIGRFATRTALVEAEVGGLNFPVRVGTLPRPLETSLMVAGCDAILGAELLRLAVLHWDFPGGRLTLEV